MVQQTIQICGKDVNLAYCYATEISFKVLAEEEIHDFLREATAKVQAQQMPDIRKAIFLIIAAMQAYYESKGETAPITDRELMYDCGAEEIGTALGTVIKLYSQFYHLVPEEAEDAAKEKGKGGKN